MSDTALLDTPYKGLEPYSEEDEAFFFGREPEQEVIAPNLMGSRLTLLYGLSGVGKSSVLRAGVAAELRRQSRQNLEAKGTPRFVIVIFNAWKDDPVVGLLSQVRQAVTDAFEGRPFPPVPTNLSFADELGAWAERVGGRLLIVLDQFEEFFLYSQKESERSFAVEFARAVNCPELRVNFLISIREDWLAKLDHFKVDIPSLFDNYLRIDRLEREAARAAIEGPARRYNELRQASEPEVFIEEGFSEKVLAQLESLAAKNVLAASGSGQVKGNGHSDATKTTIQPPYLQLVMNHLWREAVASKGHQLRPQMLEDPKKAENIVQYHVEGVMNRLKAKEQEAASQSFQHLVTPTGLKVAQARSDLAQWAKLSEAEITPMLDELSTKKNGILSPVVPPPGQRAEIRYEISHDVLAAAVLNWCKRYIDEKDLREALLETEQERRNARRLRRRSITLIAVAVLMIVFAAFGLWQFVIAKEQELDLETERELANLAKQNAEGAIRQAETVQAQATLDRSRADIAKADSENAKSEADMERARAAQSTAEADQAEQRAATQTERSQLYEQAVSLAGNGEYEPAIKRYLALSAIYGKAGEFLQQADILFQVGALMEQSKNPEALKHYTAARSLYKQLGNKRKEALALLRIGALTQLDQPLVALDAYVDAAILFQALVAETDQKVDMETLLDGAIGSINSLSFSDDAGGKEELASRLRLLPALHGNKKYRDDEIKTLERIGKIYFRLGNKKEAVRNYVLASQLDPKNSGTLTVIADIYYQLGEKQNALHYYRESAKFFANTNVQAITLASIGDIYFQLGRYIEAVDYYNKLKNLSCCQCFGRKKLADLYLQRGENQTALTLYLELISLAESDTDCLVRVSSRSQFVGPAKPPDIPNEYNKIRAEVLRKIEELKPNPPK